MPGALSETQAYELIARWQRFLDEQSGKVLPTCTWQASDNITAIEQLQRPCQAVALPLYCFEWNIERLELLELLPDCGAGYPQPLSQLLAGMELSVTQQPHEITDGHALLPWSGKKPF